MATDQQSVDLYMMLGEMRGDLKSILASMSVQAANHERLRTETDERLNQHAERITRVERFQWKLMGIAAVVPTVLTIAGLILTLLL